MKQSFLCALFTALVAFGIASGPALATDSVAELQAKLDKATREIQALKSQLAAAEAANRTKQGLPPVRPVNVALAVEHPILSAYELSSLAASDPSGVREILKGKVVSVSGFIDRFSEGWSRDYKVFLETEGSAKPVVCQFYTGSNVSSVYTAHDGSEMVVSYADRGPVTVASVKENVIISGYYEGGGAGLARLSSCVLQKFDSAE
ncbi:MAG TPA: hypothetical protein VIT21_05115 [Chthoniobacterales bacterium]